MKSLRAASFAVVRASESSSPRASRQFTLFPRSSFPKTPPVAQTWHFRSYSQELAPSKIYTFSDVRSFVEKPSSNRVLVDTREPGEVQATGTIPGSLNIPVSSKPDSFFITAEEFEERFGFERPGKDQEVVFYCKSGVRSRAAAEFARQAGWLNVAEYQGSWLDWEKNGGVKQTSGRKSS